MIFERKFLVTVGDSEPQFVNGPQAFDDEDRGYVCSNLEIGPPDEHGRIPVTATYKIVEVE